MNGDEKNALKKWSLGNQIFNQRVIMSRINHNNTVLAFFNQLKLFSGSYAQKAFLKLKIVKFQCY